MNPKTRRTLSISGIVASLLIAASPAWAQHYERHFGYGPRYVHPYRPAVVVVPPVVRYRYAPPPVYYGSPRAYAPTHAYYGSSPAYYGAPAYYGPSIGFGIYGGGRGYGRGYGRGHGYR